MHVTNLIVPVGEMEGLAKPCESGMLIFNGATCFTRFGGLLGGGARIGLG